jgi:hypothetical protein
VIAFRGQQRAEPPPVEARTRIGLAPGRDVAVTDQRRALQRRIRLAERPQQLDEPPVLDGFVVAVVRALELDADREIVAALAALVAGLAGVPCPPVEGHELDNFAVAPDQGVGRDLQPADLGEIGMALGIEAVSEQGLDVGPAEVAGGQADAVNDDQLGPAAGRPLVVIWRFDLPGVVQQSGGRVNAHGINLSGSSHNNGERQGNWCLATFVGPLAPSAIRGATAPGRVLFIGRNTPTPVSWAEPYIIGPCHTHYPTSKR